MLRVTVPYQKLEALLMTKLTHLTLTRDIFYTLHRYSPGLHACVTDVLALGNFLLHDAIKQKENY